MKLKIQKCDFFKKHIQYLGHLISDEGIQPLPEKLESIRKVSVPTNPKEVKQFLGLVGYYRKCIPRFADISRVLTKLTRKDIDFEWTQKCQDCFYMLKECLEKAPILRYPDPTAKYVLYTDVLTQEKDGTDHPVAYISGLFRGSQCRWAAMTKEAYAIYMSVKKLSFYLDSARITVRSDHLPLKRVLEKSTLNSKVNNWAVELEDQKISFEYIPGIKNVLADTLSRLIQIDSEVELPQEEEGKEFGYIPFQQLPKVQTEVITECLSSDLYDPANPTQDGKSDGKLQDPKSVKSALTIQHNEKTTIDLPIELPIADEVLRKLQEQDKETRRLIDLFNSGKMDKKLYSMDNYILKRVLVEDGIMYYPVVLPDLLRDRVLMLAHDKQGHNGALRVYNSIRRLYYWKGMKKQIRSHCS